MSEYRIDIEFERNILAKKVKISDTVLKKNQRIYRITKDADHTFQLMSNGYQSAYTIASDSYENFVKKTGLNEEIANTYYLRAKKFYKDLEDKKE